MTRREWTKKNAQCLCVFATLKQINICTLPPFKKNLKTSLVFETIIHEHLVYYDKVNASQMHADFFLRMISAPHKKFANERCHKHKHKWGSTAYHLDCIMIGNKFLNNSFISSACCLNEYLTCNDTSTLTSLMSIALLSIGSLNSPGKIIKT